MIIFFGAVVFDAVHKGYRIQHKMIVQMVFLIQMGRHQHLIPFAPKPLRQLHADLMRQLRRGLAGREGLIPMVGDHTVLLAETLFYCQHLVPCRGRQAVDAADKLPYHHCTLIVRYDRCFLRTDSIIHYIRKVLCLHIGQFLLPIEFRIIRLVRVFDIQHHLAQPALDRPDGCGSHGVTPALPEARPLL